MKLLSRGIEPKYFFFYLWLTGCALCTTLQRCNSRDALEGISQSERAGTKQLKQGLDFTLGLKKYFLWTFSLLKNVYFVKNLAVSCISSYNLPGCRLFFYCCLMGENLFLWPKAGYFLQYLEWPPGGDLHAAILPLWHPVLPIRYFFFFCFLQTDSWWDRQAASSSGCWSRCCSSSLVLVLLHCRDRNRKCSPWVGSQWKLAGGALGFWSSRCEDAIIGRELRGTATCLCR